MAPDDGRVRQLPKKSQRRRKVHDVDDLRRAASLGEPVLVAEAREGSSRHLVDEMMGPIQLDDKNGESLTNAEVHCLPGHFVA